MDLLFLEGRLLLVLLLLQRLALCAHVLPHPLHEMEEVQNSGTSPGGSKIKQHS